jgi:hypothetical protein
MAIGSQLPTCAASWMCASDLVFQGENPAIELDTTLKRPAPGFLLQSGDRWDEKVDPRSRMALSYR